MEAFAIYLLKSAIWLTGFALVYFLFLRNERFFVLNRFYLLSGIVASILFPLITVRYNVVLPATPVVEAMMPVAQGIVVAEETQSDPGAALLSFYIIGVIYFVWRMIWQTQSVVRVIRKAEINKFGTVKLIKSAGYPSSFSFFSFVFVNPSTTDAETEEIVNHEWEHIRQQHWVDLLLVELLCTMQWFNPVAWLYSRFIRQNHEYLADAVALQRTSNPAIYRAALLNQMFGGPVVSLANSFNYSLNKKRFHMMKTIITSPFRKVKILFILPVVAMVFYAFAKPEYTSGLPSLQNGNELISLVNEGVKVKGKVLKPDGTPLPGTSVIVAGTTLGAISDAVGEFELQGVSKEAEIVFSFVGYETKKVKVDSTKPMIVNMKKESVGIEGVTVVGYEGVTAFGYARNTATPPPPPPPPAGTVNVKGIENANPPLFFLDGVEISKAEMDQIDPETIGSINILKDKSSTEVYGERGKNGVILITSKKSGEAGNSQGSKTVVGYRLKEDVTSPTAGNVNIGTENVVVRSFDSKNPPLIFLDGVEINKERMEQINSDEIEKITVLKDESATILFGEKGKNGAILISSKKSGADSKPQEPVKTEQLTASGNPVYAVVEEMPEFPGGSLALRKWIASEIKYPAEAMKNGIQGKVYVHFVVDVDGRVTNTKIALGVDPSLDKEALRVTNALPLWKPGKQNDKPVAVSYTIPIQFALNNETATVQSAKSGEKEVFVVVEEMPEFPGGYLALKKWIAQNIKYPEEAKKEKLQGEVFVSFVIASDGMVKDAKIARSFAPALAKEALRVVSTMPVWKPGKQRGQAVDVEYTIPIDFKLQ